MSNANDRKTIETCRNRIDVKLVNKEKNYLKCASKCASKYLSRISLRHTKTNLHENLTNLHTLGCAYYN